MKRVNELTGYQADRPSAVALGLFDGVHKGHRQVLLEAAGKKAAGLVPAVFTFEMGDSLPSKAVRGDIVSPDMRDRLLAGLGIELLLCPPFEAVRNFLPQRFVEEILCDALRAKAVSCGFNYHFGKDGAGDAAELTRLCGQWGIPVTVTEPVEQDGVLISSSAIRAAISSGEMERAAAMLGRPFAIDFTVVMGRQLGRTLGFPTINQPLPPGFCVPRFGVYASRSHVDGKVLPGVTNIGIKPTVGSGGILAETYIIDYDGDLYGKNITVELLRFIRPEQRFSSLEQLTEQMKRDIVPFVARFED